MSELPVQPDALRHFFTGPWIKGDLLQAWLEKHGIAAVLEPTDPADPVEPTRPAGTVAGDPEDLDRPVRVLVSEADFPRAHALFFTEREGEL